MLSEIISRYNDTMNQLIASGWVPEHTCPIIDKIIEEHCGPDNPKGDELRVLMENLRSDNMRLRYVGVTFRALAREIVETVQKTDVSSETNS